MTSLSRILRVGAHLFRIDLTTENSSPILKPSSSESLHAKIYPISFLFKAERNSNDMALIEMREQGGRILAGLDQCVATIRRKSTRVCIRLPFSVSKLPYML